MKGNDKEKNVTILGRETTFNGVMKFSDVLRIEGSFKGNIDATGFLYVEKGAVCEVDYINVSSIVVEGTVRGSINSKGDVELKPHATVIGDIVALRLKIADDVTFNGTIRMLHGVPSTANDIFSMDISDFRDSLNRNRHDKEHVLEGSTVTQEVFAEREIDIAKDKVVEDT